MWVWLSWKMDVWHTPYAQRSHSPGIIPGMTPIPPFIYTLCFPTRGDLVLMLHRAKAPNRGLWNGVGGHIEAGETPTACILREVEEETGFHLDRAHFGGILTWEGYEAPAGGLYIFTAEAPAEWGEPAGDGDGEGVLEWKPRQWVFHSPEVVSNIHLFLPRVLNGAPPQAYHFVYQDGQVVGHEIKPLPPHLVI